ncbi:MAG: hypothetical protein ACO3LE_11100, partial [Bdellovibrionota bacterium]
MGTKSDVDKNNKKIYDRLAKTDPEKAAKFHDNLMKIRKEEIEQNDKMKEKDLPFTPDKKKVRRGPGGPMSQARWLARHAMRAKMREMGMKEEVESVEEGLLKKAATVAKNVSGIVNPKTPEEKAKSIQRSAQASFYTSRLKRDDANRKAAGMKPLSGIDRLKTKAAGLKRAAEPYVKAALKGVREEAVSFGRSGGVMHYDPNTEKSEKPAKGVSALDKDGNLVGHYRDLETAKKLKPGHTYQTSKGVAKEEVEQANEAAKDWKRAFSKVAAKNFEKDIAAVRSSAHRLDKATRNFPAKPDTKPTDSNIDYIKQKARKGLTKPHSMQEEVEQVEEGAKETAMRAFDLADKMRKKNPAQAKIYQKL